MWVEANGVSIYYSLCGTGPTAVLLHEMGGTAESFDGLVPLLAPSFQVLSYDQRGCGRSEKVRSPSSAAEQVSDLAALLEVLGLSRPCHVVAVAAAGIPAVQLALRGPELVASLVLCNPALGVDGGRSAVLEERADMIEARGVRSMAIAALGQSYPEELRDEGVYQSVRGWYMANDPYSLAWANRILARTDVRGVMGSVGCPVMVVAGDMDRVRPPERSGEIAGLVPGARFEVVPGGHFLSATSPGPLAALLLDFWGSLSAAVSGDA